MFKFIKKVATPILTGLLILAISIPLLHSPKADAETDETVYYYLTDHLGSVDVVLDEDGNVVEHRDYLPYGSARAEVKEPGAPETAQGFTGKELDDETGLQYYGARYYDPLIGRFVSVDPVVKDEGSKPLADVLPNPQALNAYSYVTNNPLKFVDPTGMYKEDVHYDLTFYLALKAGLTRGQSKVIAYYDQDVDDNPETSPINTEATLEYHFADRTEAIRRVNAAIDSKSSPDLGTALHTYQDTYSHGGITPSEHIVLDIIFKNPDRTYADVKKAMKMSEETFFFLRLHHLRTAGPGDISAADFRKQGIEIWNEIEGDVHEYLSLKNKEETQIAKDAKEAKEE